ncbi:hypothetical protein SMNI109538_10180 [Smaragdicoccus niigatensis]
MIADPRDQPVLSRSGEPFPVYGRRFATSADCHPLTWPATRDTFSALFSPEFAARFDDETITWFAAVLRPLYLADPGRFFRANGMVPVAPWAHIGGLAGIRIDMLATFLPDDPPAACAHPCGLACAECGIGAVLEWGTGPLIDGFPLCSACTDEGCGEPGTLGEWRRVASVFGPGTFSLAPREGFAVSDVLVSFRELCKADPRVPASGYLERWGFLSADDRDHLAAWATAFVPHVVPPEWVRRWGRAPAPREPAPGPLTAVLV